MNTPLSFFNWSLTKAQEAEPEGLGKARIRIIFMVLLFSMLKACVVLVVGTMHEQWLQVSRAGVALVIYMCLLKYLLYKPLSLKRLAHVMINFGILIIWTNVFAFAHKINLLTVQFAFLIALSSFYTLGSRMGFLYSTLGMLPVTFYFLVPNLIHIGFTRDVQELAFPGFEIIVVLNFVSLLVSHHLFFQALNVNIREKNELNQQLQSSIAEATQLAESKSNFLSTMSHELRTPLNSVIGITELLLEDKPELRQTDNLKTLQLSAHDLLALINNILDFNKIDSGKLKLDAVPFRLDEFMQNICAVLRVKANNKHLLLNLNIDKRLERINVVGDPTRLSQVIYNIVGNAVKFTDQGRITVALSQVLLEGDRIEVLFSISDTGIGIHPDRHEEIFEMFSQGESSRKRDGTGLGLAIVKQLLRLFDSSIQVESAPGKGSKFFFTIPFVATAVAEEIKTSVQTPEVGDFGELRVLIAEDNDVNRQVLKLQMGKLKVYPVMVENGQQAFETYSSGNFDIVFLDLHMPVASGYEAAKLIREMADPVKAGVNMVAFTASVTEQEKIFNAGFDDFLYKPANINDLRSKLEKVTQLKLGTVG
jgi:signal transduction histidine kinase